MEKRPLNIQYLFNMCVNKRYVLNPYIHKRILVDCGHCEACQQERAIMRTNRIRNEYDSNYIMLFGTLTYDRASCPFVYLKDIKERNFPLNVYREHKVRYVRVGHQTDYTQRVRRTYKQQLLTTINIEDDYGFDYYFKTLRHRQGKVGVCYFKDWQNFAKRFRIICQRHFGINYTIKMFDCFEYGETTNRPHIHFLAKCRPSDEEKLRLAVVQAWPFADRRRTYDNIELARDAAGYVGSYLNSGSSFPKFLKKNFNPKHSFSKGFGMANVAFSLPKILSLVDSGTFEYNTIRNVAGVPSVVTIPIPKYVVNRYFPVFKGASRLAPSSLVNYIYSMRLLKRDLFSYHYGKRGKYLLDLQDIGYSHDDLRKISTSLRNAFKRYHDVTGRSRFQYAQDWMNTWKAYKMTHLKEFYENKDEENWLFRYDNISEYYFRHGRNNPSLNGVPLPSRLIWNYNELPAHVNKTIRLTASYHSYLKTKSVNNAVLSNQYSDV